MYGTCKSPNVCKTSNFSRDFLNHLDIPLASFALLQAFSDLKKSSVGGNIQPIFWIIFVFAESIMTNLRLKIQSKERVLWIFPV